MASEIPEELQRWTAKRRVALVTSILKADTSVQEAARKDGLTVAEIEDSRDRLLLAAENALRARHELVPLLEKEFPPGLRLDVNGHRQRVAKGPSGEWMPESLKRLGVERPRPALRERLEGGHPPDAAALSEVPALLLNGLEAQALGLGVFQHVPALFCGRRSTGCASIQRPVSTRGECSAVSP
jgi:hypothetical protein